MGQTIGFELEADNGDRAQSGESPAAEVPAAVLRRATDRLAALAAATVDGRWQAWPRRARKPTRFST